MHQDCSEITSDYEGQHADTQTTSYDEASEDSLRVFQQGDSEKTEPPIPDTMDSLSQKSLRALISDDDWIQGVNLNVNQSSVKVKEKQTKKKEKKQRKTKKGEKTTKNQKRRKKQRQQKIQR